MRSTRSGQAAAFSLAAMAAATLSLAAMQNPPLALSAADYAHAESFMSYKMDPLVLHSGVEAHWLAPSGGPSGASGDDAFWYRVTAEDGPQFYLVDPAQARREPTFDRAGLAAALSAAAGKTYAADALPFTSIDFSADRKAVTFHIGSQTWRCHRQGAACAAVPPPNRGNPDNTVTSPDGKTEVFIRNYNLWARDRASGRETQLTTDGVKDFGYATDNAGWVHSDQPIVLWSPDSTKLATFQQDQRRDGDMILASTAIGHPVLEQWKYPLPGDKDITTIQRVVIELPGPGEDHARVVRFQMPPDQHRSTIDDNLAFAPDEDVQWSPDGKQVAFISTSRDHKDEHLRLADAATGAVRDVYEEKVSTEYEGGGAGGPEGGDYDCFRFLPRSGEFIWYSQRDNFGQLYLYDLQSGKLKNQITTGSGGDVTRIVHVDEAARTVTYMATGREPGRNPYFSQLYRVGFDGSNQHLLTPEDADHAISPSPSGRYFVDVYSTPQTPPIAVVRDRDGKVVLTLEKADISRLVAAGWKPPQSVVVKARDGVTDLYGLMFVPTHLEPGRKYPIVNHIYPGPQIGSVGSRSFAAARSDDQALAELGFVVVAIDGMGTPYRGRKFHDAYYGDMGDNTLPDQVAAMKELAQRYPFIDIERAGIYGHSGGGYATADAMFRYPDFFKVGIAESGNHDQRDYEDDWGERYQGLLTDHSYDNQDNEAVAKNLKGRLLLAYGTMDDNVPPNNTLLVVQALIQANKDFDLIALPNKPHGYGDMSGYMQRRRWDYFVRYLMGAQPPHDYKMQESGRGGPQ